MSVNELLALVIGGSFAGCAVAMLISEIVGMLEEEMRIRREMLTLNPPRLPPAREDR